MEIEEFLDMLRCPVCLSKLNIDGGMEKLICKNCNEQYLIIENILIVIPSKELKKSAAKDIYENLYRSVLKNEVKRQKIPYHYFEDLRKIKELNIRGKVIIDAGGGRGFIARNLVNEADKVIVADLSFTALKELSMVNSDNMILICGDIQKHFFAPKIADIIICTAVLQSPKDALINFKETLKDDGTLYVQVPVINLPFSNFFLYVFRKIKRRDIKKVKSIHLRVYSTKSIIDKLSSVGFSISKVDYISVLTEFENIPPKIASTAKSIIQKSGLLKKLLASGIQVTCRKK